ncbi:MFS transporter [Leuconostoc pseudomesenteroides]|uniref:MFS transporter n=1 Tax=Leuconostoc pseudomesenteroides TaxID=33968 RepID=A0ABT6HEG7_LEUPS|nr:MFS transporter [Leuconostoc pseudomesenteroides]MDG9734450.1 MFS transporter [Leuconostoc pseudomesenteroides]NKZ36690.1 MFS transporter [Leuconostoc pseudomesenteroides]QQB26482.1 MFS transporter [Leuconostoc pseudomesenteroides]
MNEKQFPSKIILNILTVLCALAVANLYYDQVLIVHIIKYFNVSTSQGGSLITNIQIGYTLGLLLIVPLGDRFNRKTLIVTSLVSSAIFFSAMAFSPNFFIMKVFGLFMGFSTVSAQLVIPFVSSNSNTPNKGKLTSKLLFGVFLGVLIGRVISGLLGQYLDWQMIHLIISFILLIGAIFTVVILPRDSTNKQSTYIAILKSLPEIVKDQPVLRETMVFGFAAFATFNIFWVPLTFILVRHPYNFDTGIVGLFGLIGVLGSLAAGFSGKLADSSNARNWNTVALFTMIFSFLLLSFTWQNIIGIIIVTLILDVGSRMNMTLNQGRIYHLDVKLHSRLNSLYMVTYYLGGSLGSIIGTRAYQNFGIKGLVVSSISILSATISYSLFKSKHKK